MHSGVLGRKHRVVFGLPAAVQFKNLRGGWLRQNGTHSNIPADLYGIAGSHEEPSRASPIGRRSGISASASQRRTDSGYWRVPKRDGVYTTSAPITSKFLFFL